MKKLLIATTALVATAGMASADITISGHAAAGIFSGLDYTAPVDAVAGKMTTTLQSTADVAIDAAGKITAGAVTAAVVGTVATTDAQKLAARNAVADAESDLAAASTAEDRANEAADLADAQANLAAIIGSDAVASTASADGVYSNAGVDFTMTGATDNGISFSAISKHRRWHGS